jgi:hypothetical protein
MTKDEARARLEDNSYVCFDSWCWTKWRMTCSTTDEGEHTCCLEDFNNIEEALDHLEDCCSGNWEGVY